MSTETKKAPREGGVGLAILKFAPLIVMMLLVIVVGLELVLAAAISVFVAAAISMFVNRCGFDDAFEFGAQAVRGIVMVFFVNMFAYAVGEVFMATGVGAALINLSLAAGVTARTIAVIAFLLTCALSLATGTSWGTFAACAPIFLWLNYLLGGNTVLVLGAIAGGSCFGDNIGMISDTTVLSCGMQDVKIIDRVKHQGPWSVLCIVITVIITFAMSMSLPSTQGSLQEALASIPAEAYEVLEVERPGALTLLEQVQTGVPVYMVIPFVLVIATAFTGMNTMLCLGSGVVSALVLGLIAGECTLMGWLNDMMLAGFSSSGGSAIIMMMWVAAFGGIMNSMGAFEPLAKLAVKMSANVHHLMGWCGVLCIVGNAALADEAAEIATFSPIVRGIVEEEVEASEEDMYKLRTRLATFTDALGVYGSELIPWHCYPVFFLAIASGVFPIEEIDVWDIIVNNWMSMISVLSILILTFTGLDRFIPLFGLPKNAKLKKKLAK